MKSSFSFMVGLCLLALLVGCRNAGTPAAEPESSVSQESEGFRPTALGMQLPLLTRYEQLDKHVGQLVAVRGTVSSSKIATIIGVDVEPGELRGEDSFAVGILTKWTTEREKFNDQVEEHGPIATRGPETTFTLYSDLSGSVAQARKWPRESN